MLEMQNMQNLFTCGQQKLNMSETMNYSNLYPTYIKE